MSSGTWQIDGTEYKVGRFNFIFRKTKHRGWVKSTRTINELNEESFHQAYKNFSHTRTQNNKSIALSELEKLILFYKGLDSQSYRHFKRKKTRLSKMKCEPTLQKRGGR